MEQLIAVAVVLITGVLALRLLPPRDPPADGIPTGAGSSRDPGRLLDEPTSRGPEPPTA